MNLNAGMLLELNDRQSEAVLYFDSPLLVLAGAGSGKTRVLTYKIAYIIKELRSSPYGIFAVTFTNKAADEMKQRVEKLASVPVRGMWVGTFHSMCVRIIKMHRRESSLNKDFSIYDSNDSKNLIKRIIDEKNIENKMNAKTACKAISRMKNAMVFPEEFFRRASSDEERMLAEIYMEYQFQLEKNNALDFDDLLLETVLILKRDPVFRERLQSMFKYILVDEYQDTNYVQYAMLKLLFSGYNHITVVGDDDQSIYGFRGAEIGNILRFDSDFKNTRIVKLEQNYRSTQIILDAANNVISNNENRKEKNLWCEKKGGESVSLKYFADEGKEAQYVIEKIESICSQNKHSLRDIAVLYRTNAQSRPFEEQLRKHNIRYTIVGSIKFFERKEIKDILAYLSLAINHRDSVSFRRIANTPRRGLGDKAIEEIERFSNEKNISLMESVIRFSENKKNLSKQAAKGIQDLSFIMEKIFEKKDDACSAAEIVIQMTGYQSTFESLDEIERISKMENIQELLNSLKEFSDKNEEKGISDYLDMISLYTDIDDANNSDDSVLIMTVHNAKGLEFEVVFVTGLEEGLFPHFNSFETTKGIEEERRLMYVAMTRAKRKLFITSALTRKRYGMGSASIPSRFIREMKENAEQEVNEETAFSEKTALKDVGFKMFSEENIKRDSNDKKSCKFSVGDKVSHPFYGSGTIRNIKGSGDDIIATVSFFSGETKKIFLQYANMKRI